MSETVADLRPGVRDILHECLQERGAQKLLHASVTHPSRLGNFTNRVALSVERRSRHLVLAAVLDEPKRQKAKAALEQIRKEIRKELANEFWTVRRLIRDTRRAVREQQDMLTRLSAEYTNRLEKNWTWDYPTIPPATLEASLTGAGLPQESGVYFVWRGGAIIYVGQSINLSVRCRCKGHEHIYAGDLLSWVLVPQQELLTTEAFYIGIARPSANFGRLRRAA